MVWKTGQQSSQHFIERQENYCTVKGSAADADPHQSEQLNPDPYSSAKAGAGWGSTSQN